MADSEMARLLAWMTAIGLQPAYDPAQPTETNRKVVAERRRAEGLKKCRDAYSGGFPLCNMFKYVASKRAFLEMCERVALRQHIK